MNADQIHPDPVSNWPLGRGYDTQMYIVYWIATDLKYNASNANKMVENCEENPNVDDGSQAQ